MNVFRNIWKGMEPKIAWLLLTAFCVVTLVLALVFESYSDVAICIAVIVLMTVPRWVEMIFHIRIHWAMNLCIMLFAVCAPLIGEVYSVYHIFNLWDKILHAFCGVLCALIGFCLPEFLEPEFRHSTFFKCVCAFMLAMTIAGLWEFYEFGCDQILGTDLQNDRFVYYICSYLLGDSVTTTDTIRNITSVTVNGIDLPGYIDVGIFDTMTDMLACAVGAFVFCIFEMISKCKIPMMIRKDQRTGKRVRKAKKSSG